MGESPNPTITSGRELHPGVKLSKGCLAMAESLFESAKIDDSRQRDHVKAEIEEH